MKSVWEISKIILWVRLRLTLKKVSIFAKTSLASKVVCEILKKIFCQEEGIFLMSDMTRSRV